jgi:hypothetical protein
MFANLQVRAVNAELHHSRMRGASMPEPLRISFSGPHAVSSRRKDRWGVLRRESLFLLSNLKSVIAH